MCSDNRLYFYKQRGNTVSYFSSFDIGGVTQHQLFYLPMHKVWVSSGKDLQMYRFTFTDKNKLQLEKPQKLHDDQITSVVEVTIPCRCIITGGLDKRIVMFSMTRNQILRVLPQQHQT